MTATYSDINIRTIHRCTTPSRAQHNRPRATNAMPVAIPYKSHQHSHRHELTSSCLCSDWPKSVSQVLVKIQYTDILVKHMKRKACARPAQQQCRISCTEPDGSDWALCPSSTGWALDLSGSSVCTGTKRQVIEEHLKCTMCSKCRIFNT